MATEAEIQKAVDAALKKRDAEFKAAREKAEKEAAAEVAALKKQIAEKQEAKVAELETSNKAATEAESARQMRGEMKRKAWREELNETGEAFLAAVNKLNDDSNRENTLNHFQATLRWARTAVEAYDEPSKE